MKYFYQNISSKFFVADLVSKMVLLALIPFIKLNLSPEEYIKFGHLGVILSLLLPIVGISATASFAVSFYEKISLNKIFTSIGITLATTVLVITAFANIFLSHIEHINILIMAAAISNVYNLCLLKFRLQLQLKQFTIIQMSSSFMILLIVFVIIERSPVTARVMSSVIAEAILIITMIYVSTKSYTKNHIFVIDLNDLWFRVKYSVPVVIFSVASWIRFGYERHQMSSLPETLRVADIFFIYNIALIITMVAASAVAGYSVELQKLVHDRLYKHYTIMTGKLTLIALVFCISVTLIEFIIANKIGLTNNVEFIMFLKINTISLIVGIVGLFSVVFYQTKATTLLAILGCLFSTCIWITYNAFQKALSLQLLIDISLITNVGFIATLCLVGFWKFRQFAKN